MSGLLVALLLAQSPVPTATDTRLQRWTEQAHEHWIAGRHEEAIQTYTRILAAAPDDQWKANALGPRATLLLAVGRPDEALADARVCAELFPTAVHPLQLQVLALDQLGRTDEAQALQQQIETLYELSADPLGAHEWFGQSPWAGIAQGTIAALAAAFFVGSLLLINCAIARRQRGEGHGSWSRLIAVAAAVCALQLIPFLVCGIVVVSPLAVHAGSSIPPAAVCIGLTNIVVLFSALGPTARFLHSSDPLPLVQDEGFLTRVAELATRMGLPVPVVRLLPTGGGELQAQALAGGLVAPSLVVADGILHRLTPDERDATMAHELAHLANGSLWWLTAAAPIAATAGAVASLWLSFGMSYAIAFTSWVGVRHLISRHLEYDCDRRAAQVLGYRTTYSALTKIHAASVLRDRGWLSFLVFATATHPSRAQRLAAIVAASPPDDRPTATWSEEDLIRRQRAGWTAATVWLTALLAIPCWALRNPDSLWPSAVLVMIGAAPWLAILLAARGASRDLRRRMVSRNRYRHLLPLLLGIAAMGWVLFADQLEMPFDDTETAAGVTTRIVTLLILTLVLPSLLLWFLWSLMRRGRDQTLVQQVAIAMQTRDFAKVFELARTHPKPFARSAILRHNLGFAAAMTCDRQRAKRVLEDLRRDEPGFAESVLVLAMVHVDETDPAAALPLIDEVHDRLPADPTPLMLRGHVLHLLGRLEEAQECINQTLQLKPDSGNTHAVAAWIALGRGERRLAEELLIQAEELDPGTAFIQYVKAVVALAGDDPVIAREQVQQAVAASDANPYALLQKQTQALLGRLPVEVSPSAREG